MEIFDGHRALFRPLATPAVAVGSFDGVHIGHRRLVDEAVSAARALDGDAVVFTFDPHPARVLAPNRAPKLICTRERKLELLADRGVTVAVLEPFTAELAAMEPDEFLREVFTNVLGARVVVVGYDFTFGRDRGGNAETLKRYGAKHDIDVRIIEPVGTDNGAVASSSEIRRGVAAGDLAAASTLLGRDFDVDGVVVEGAKRGSQIGIPTANVNTGRAAAELMPPPGIYATWVQLLESGDPKKQYAAATSLGTNPTFVDDGALTLEAHMLDFDGDIYGQRVRVGFIEHLRDEEKFDGIDALLAQIHDDIRRTRDIVSAREK